MSVMGEASRSFSGGRVFSRAIQSIQTNLQSFGLFGLACFAAPSVILGVLMLPMQQAALAGGGAPNIQWGPTILAGLVGGAFTLIGYAGLIWAYWSNMSGRSPSFGEMFKYGVGAALPVLLVGFLFGLGVMAGFFLLFVPGVILGLMWCVAVPVQVIERPGGLGAFGRSRALTRGKRWALFGMFLLYFVALYAFLLVIALVVGLGAGVGTIAAMSLVTGPFAIVRVLLTAVMNGVFGVFGAVFTASLYYELRMFKDGMAPQALSDVFA